MTIKDKCKEILISRGIHCALAYLCVQCRIAPIDAKEIVYDLI